MLVFRLDSVFRTPEKAKKWDFIQEWYRRGYPNFDFNNGIEIHHVKPREFGGDNSFENLIPIPSSVHRKYVTPWWNSYKK